MTGTKRGQWRMMLTGLIAVSCWLIALFVAESLIRQYDGLSVRFSEAAVTQKELQRASGESEDEGLVCVAAWTREQKLLAASSELGTSAQIRVIEGYGDMQQIAPMQLLRGSFPVMDDYSGCAIDAESAWKLFHSTDAIGAKVTIGEKNYVVRGIAEAYEPMLLLRNSNAHYENLEFSASNSSAAKQLVETFLYRCNAAGSFILVQSGLLARLALGFVWLAACLFGFAGAVSLLKSARMKRKEKRGSLPFLLSGIVLLVVSVAVLLKTAYWPQSFLPTKWSDFGFWRTLFEGWNTQWKAISLMTPLPKEIQLFQALRKCIVLLFTAVFTGAWCAALHRTTGKRQG